MRQTLSQAPSARTLRYEASLARFEAWLCARCGADSSFRGAGVTSAAYMPLPVYAQAAGRPGLGAVALRLIQERHIAVGLLVQDPSRRDMMPYVPAWVLLGSALCEDPRMRVLMARQVLSYQDPRTGGLFGSARSRRLKAGVIDFDSTTLACPALCVAGEDDAAARCGQYLLRLIRAQPSPSRFFFLQWDTGRGLVRDFAPASSPAHLVTYTYPGQHLYKIGLLARALALVHGVTGESEYLQLAQAYYRKAASDSPDVWTNTLAHKMGWAAWTLACATGQRSYAEDACRMADHLARLQQPDGGFHYPELWTDYAAIPLDMKVNLSAQFATWIALAAEASRP